MTPAERPVGMTPEKLSWGMDWADPALKGALTTGWYLKNDPHRERNRYTVIGPTGRLSDFPSVGAAFRAIEAERGCPVGTMSKTIDGWLAEVAP